MKAATMLYQSPGPHMTDGIRYDYIVVDEAEVEAKLAEGWHRHYDDAHAVAQKAAGEQLAANEAEQRQIEQQLGEAGASKPAKAKKGEAGASK